MIKEFLHIVLIILLISISPLSYAQIKTNVSFSDSRLEKAKALNKTRKEYKRYMKDSLKNIKKLNRHYDFKLDSLMDQLEKEAHQRANIPLPSVDTLDNYSLDSLKGEQYTRAQQEYQRKKEAYRSQYGLDSSYFKLPEDRDSLMLKQQEQLLASFEKEAIANAGINDLAKKPELPGGENPIETYKPEFNRFKAGKTLKNNMDKFPKVNLDKLNTSLNDAYEKMGSLKKKYASLPSMNDLKGGIKVNSLKGQPLGERIKWGGNFTIRQQENTINVDFSPSIAYRVTKKLSTGIEAMYRTQFGNGRNLGDSFFSADTYGGRHFNEYIVLKSIYVRTEFETLSTRVKSTQDNTTETEVVLGAMAGIGNSFTLTNSLHGKINIQYNFLYNDDNPVYTSPWVIRFGLEFKKKNK